MMETWVEQGDWEEILDKLPGGWDWMMQPATRVAKRGRAKGGIVVGVRQGEIKLIKDSVK